MTTTPAYIPPIPPAEILNTQDSISKTLLTVAGDSSIIPILYGKCQVGGHVFAVDYDEGTEVWTVGVYWGWGECSSMDATFLNGEAPVGGVTQQDHLGTATQTVDSLLAAAISGYTDTLVVTNDFGTLGICYSVFQYLNTDYETFPDFVAELSARKVYDTREGGHVKDRSWSLLSPSYESKTLDVSGKAASPQGVTLNPDGSKMYVVGYSEQRVEEYDLTTPFDLTTATWLQSFDISLKETNPVDLAFSSDGLIMFVLGIQVDDVTYYDLSVAWDISSAIYNSEYNLAGKDTEPRGLCFSLDGLHMYMCGITNDKIFEYTLSTAWDLTTVSFTNEFGVGGQDTSPQAIVISSDGLSIFLVGETGNDINEYTLSIAYAITSANYTRLFSIVGQETTPLGLAINPAGTKMYVSGSNSGGDVWQYQLDTAPDTWAFTETPALCQRDYMVNKFFGPGELVNDASVTIVANDNDATATSEVRRKLGLVIKNRQRWDTWRQILDSYMGGWSFKRGVEWVLVSDRPRSADFVVNDSGFVKDSTKILLPQLFNKPTHVKILYTDKTESIWRERVAEAELVGVASGIVSRRSSDVRMPGITRYSQAKREANERLEKLQSNIQFEGQLFDDHIGVEIGDRLTITSKLGLSSVDMRVIARPRIPKIGRPLVRLSLYKTSYYDDSEDSIVIIDPGTADGIGNIGIAAGATVGAIVGTNLVDQIDSDLILDNEAVRNRYSHKNNMFADPNFADPNSLVWEITGNDPWARTLNGEVADTPCMERTAGVSGGSILYQGSSETAFDSFSPVNAGDTIYVKARYFHTDESPSESINFQFYSEDLSEAEGVDRDISNQLQIIGEDNWGTVFVSVVLDSNSEAQYMRIKFGSGSSSTETTKIQWVHASMNNKLLYVSGVPS